MGNIFKNNEAVVHFGNDEQLTVFPKNSVWYKIGLDSNMVEFRSRYNDEIIFYENDITETTINEEIPENFITEFNKIAYGGGKPEITDYDILAVYNVASTTEPTKLSNSTYLTKNVAAMYIDDEQVEIGNAAQFEKVGEHTVKYKLKDNTTIGTYAFRECPRLKEINISDGVRTISSSAFTMCSSLSYATFGNSVTSIGNYAFSGCKSLISINIPDSVETIGDLTFNGCTSVSSITIGSGLKTIGNGAFLTLSDIFSIKVSEDNTYFNSRNNSNAIISTITNQLLRGSSQTVIPYGVTSIGEGAFNNCRSLTELVIPNSVTSIGNMVFYYCDSLKSIDIPNSVEIIGNRCFAYSSFSSVTFQSITEPECGNELFFKNTLNGVLYYPCGSDYSNVISNLPSTWSNECFGEKPEITDYDVMAVYNVEDISQPTKILGTTSNVGKMYVDDEEAPVASGYTFSTTGEHTVKYKYQSKVIPNKGFVDCEQIISVVITNGVTRIGSEAFKNCKNLVSVTIPDSVTIIDPNAFNTCEQLNEITIPNTVTIFGSRVFHKCYSLTSITLPDSISSVPQQTFEYCSGLTSVTLPETITAISSSAFTNCTSLSEITLPDSLTTINLSAFENCSSLTEVVIPESVTSIAGSTFKNCNSLSSITFNSLKAPAIGNGNAFYGVQSTGTLSFPCAADYSTVTSNQYFKNWNVECFEKDGIYNYDVATFVTSNVDGYNAKLFNNQATTFINYIDKMYVDGVEITPTATYTLDAGTHSVKYVIKEEPASDYKYSIYTGAFSGCTSIITAIIGERIEMIDNQAFNGCTSLTNVMIPDSVRYVGGGVFERTGLKEFTFKQDTIYGSALLQYSKVQKVTYANSGVGANDCKGCTDLTSVTLSNSVTNIGNYAFSGCTSLTSINIPASLTEVGGYAFASCSSLSTINCYGKELILRQNSFANIASTGIFTYYCDCNLIEITPSFPSTYTKSCVKEYFADYDVIATFNITDVSQPVTLYEGTTNLSSIAIGDNEIGKVSTYNFGKTGEYTVKYKLTTTKQPSFKNCNMMETVELLEGCTVLKYNSLAGCTSLTSLTLPSTITSITNFALTGTTSLRVIRCYANPAPTVDTYSFSDMAKYGMLYFPCGADYSSWFNVGSLYNLTKLGWSSDCFTVAPDLSKYDISTIINVTSTTEPTQLSADEITTQWFTSTPFRNYVDKMYVDGVEVEPATYHTFESEGAHVVGYTLLNNISVPMAAFSGCSNLTYVGLSDRITFISPNAFEATTNLQHIDIPDSVTEISNGAFYASGIRYAFIGSGVTTIAWNGMQNCPNLEVIFFKAAQAPSYQADTFVDNPNLTTIGYLCGYDPDSFTALATSINIANVECISEEELQNFIDSL